MTGRMALRRRTLGSIPPTTYPAAPGVACSWAPTNQTSWAARMAMTRYVASAALKTISTEEKAVRSSTGAGALTQLMEKRAMMSSTEVTGTTSWSQARARMSSMAAMATIFLVAPIVSGSGTSSIAAKARTNTLLTITTMWTAIARRSWSAERLDHLRHR